MNSRRVLLVACGVLGITAVVPSRWFSWLDGFRWAQGTVKVAIAPIAEPLRSVLQAVRGPKTPLTEAQQEHLKQEAREGAMWKLQYEKSQASMADLQRQLASVQGMAMLNSGFVAKQVTLPVIGVESNGTMAELTFRGGTLANTMGNAAADRSAVAVTEGVFLVGRVTYWASVSHIQPIADRSAGELRGAILTDERFADDSSTAILSAQRIREKFQVVLMPTGLGTLAGPVLNIDGKGTGVNVTEGMVVRLDQRGAWPEHAQMLVVGRVTRVTEQGNGRKIVTVAPLYDLSRIGEVTIRFLDGPDAPAGSPARPSGGGR